MSFERRLVRTTGVMAGLDPAVSLEVARCNPDRDHRVTALRAGPVMTGIT